MATNPAALLRRASTDRISRMLRGQVAVNPSLNPSIPTSGFFPDAGQFGGPATLPRNPGPPDPILPGALPGANLPNDAFGTGPTRNDFWTRMDPGMGYINPSVEINPSDNSHNANFNSDPATGAPGGDLTGGQPPPSLANRLLHSFIPFSGQAPGTPGGGQVGGAGTQPQTPAWFQPGYQPPAGIQNAVSRGDYGTAYGASPDSIAAGAIAASQSYGGAPNYTGSTQDAGRTSFMNLGGQTIGHADENGVYAVHNPAYLAARIKAYRDSVRLNQPTIQGPMAGGGVPTLGQLPQSMSSVFDATYGKVGG